MSKVARKSLESRLDRHLMTCAAVAAGFGAVAVDQADAVVIYTNPADITVSTANYGWVGNLVTGVQNNGTDLVQGASVPGWDLNVQTFLFFGEPTVVADLPTGGSVIGRVVGIYTYADRLAAGAPIGPASAFVVNSAATIIYGDPELSPPTSWQNDGVQGFLGIRFAEGASNPLFGWVRISLSPGLLPTGEYNVTIHDWAYESTPGVGLNAGDGIPEPGSMSLALLALGAIGTRRWRGASAN